MTYRKILNEALAFYRRGEYQAAFDYLTENKSKITGSHAQVYNFLYCFACKAGNTGLALQLLTQAVKLNVFWYSYEYLINDDDLELIRNTPQFIELAELCREREQKAIAEAKPARMVLTPRGESEKYPLLIALHGNEENSEIAKENWYSALREGIILALPQSSQISFYNGFRWNDIEKGIRELTEHAEALSLKYSMDSSQMIVAGFSARARTALYSVLGGTIAVKGLILVAPWLPELSEWEGHIEKLNDVKVCLICGDKDEECLEGAERLVKRLEEKKITVLYQKISGLAHDFPLDFGNCLKKFLDFIV